MSSVLWYSNMVRVDRERENTLMAGREREIEREKKRVKDRKAAEKGDV